MNHLIDVHNLETRFHMRADLQEAASLFKYLSWIAFQFIKQKYLDLAPAENANIALDLRGIPPNSPIQDTLSWKMQTLRQFFAAGARVLARQRLREVGNILLAFVKPLAVQRVNHVYWVAKHDQYSCRGKEFMNLFGCALRVKVRCTSFADTLFPS